MHRPTRSPIQFVPSTPCVYTSDTYSGAEDQLNAVVPDIHVGSTAPNTHNFYSDSPLAGIVPRSLDPRQPTSQKQAWVRDRFIHPSPYLTSQLPFVYWDRNHGVGSTPRISHTKSRYKDEPLQEVPRTPQCMKTTPCFASARQTTPSNQTQCTTDKIQTPSFQINGRHGPSVGNFILNRRQNRILYPSQHSPEARPLQLFDGEEIFL